MTGVTPGSFAAGAVGRSRSTLDAHNPAQPRARICMARFHSCFTIAALLTALFADSYAAPAVTSAGKRPSEFVRACGEITAHGRRIHVDIGEGNGKLVTCRHARKV